KITLPLLRPVLVFVLVTSIIGSFQVFDTVAVTTRGGPAGSTRVIIYYIYQQVFERRIKMGMATAASVVLFAILITVTIVQMRLLRSGESDLADYQ
ncbi:MAG TPA: sugar ABC transporter permease, partial [Anaerolineales bacterium]|nr:sugar ABC transporter permease [Anaerolineales bacterium]